MVMAIRMFVLVFEVAAAQLAQWTGAAALAAAILSGWLGGRWQGVVAIACIFGTMAHVWGDPVAVSDKVAGASGNIVFLILIYGVIAIMGSLAGASARWARRRRAKS